MQAAQQAVRLSQSALIGAALCLALLCLSPLPRALAAADTPVIDTAITAGPAEGALIGDDEATFGFSATRDGSPFPEATFRCALDAAPPQPCASPLRLTSLDEGIHTFSVSAEDPEHLSGDPEPATRAFVVIEEEGEAGEEECEELEAEEDDELESEELECEAPVVDIPPEECLLRSARARVLAPGAQNRVRLMIRYTAFAATEVAVEYRMTGGRGSTRLGAAHLRIAGRGLVRLSARLSKARMAKVRSARRIIVTIRVPGAPAYCHRYETRRLSVRRASRRRTVWLQSDSVFGTGL